MTDNAHGLAQWMDRNPFADLDIPAALDDSIRRHREHIAQLIVSLRSAGVADQHIEDSVSVIVQSYKEELLRAIRSHRDQIHTQ